MKLTGRQSNNVLDQTQNTSQFAPHSNPFTNHIINASRAYDTQMANKWAQQHMALTLQQAASNPFRQILQGMTKANMVQPQPGANIPIPTPRPDPTQPYTKPTVFQ